MKKNYWIQLLACTTISVLLVVFNVNRLHKKHIGFIQRQATDVFDVALFEGLQKWQGIEVYYSNNGKSKFVTLSNYFDNLKKEPKKVSLQSEYGTKDFWVPYEKYSRNIEQSSTERIKHSCLLHSHPLNADSLNLFWQELLAKSGLSGTTIVRITTTDWEERDSCAYSSDSLYLPKADSLSVYYIGGRSEVGITGYLYCTWWQTLSKKDWLWLAVLFVGCFLLLFVLGYISRRCLRLFVRKKQMVAEKEATAFKEVTVIVDRKSGSHIYRLEEGVYFDTHSRLLKKGDMTVLLNPQSAQLLQGFLNAKDGRLSNDEILQLLWPDGSGTQNKLYQVIKRLRESLSEISICTIDNEKFAYQLKIPHFIEENPI